MAVVKPAADPSARSVKHVHHSARRNPSRRLFDHFLEDPRMRGPPLDFQADAWSLGGVEIGHRTCLSVGSSWVILRCQAGPKIPPALDFRIFLLLRLKCVVVSDPRPKIYRSPPLRRDAFPASIIWFSIEGSSDAL